MSGVYLQELADDQLDELARERQGRGDLVGAVKAYREALRRVEVADAGRPATSKKHPSPILLANLGYCLQQAARHAEAVVCLDKATEQEPSSQRLRAAAFSHGELGQFEDMRRCATRATELDPSDDYAWQQLAIAHRAAGDLPASIAANTRAIGSNPRNAYARMNLACDLWGSDRERSLEEFARALALDPHLRAALLGYDGYAELRADAAFVALVDDEPPQKPAQEDGVEERRALGKWLGNASVQGDIESVVGALDAGAALERRSANMGRTALNAAAGGAHVAVVHLLIERGADVHARDGKGNSALSRLVESGHDVELARYLLDHGARGRR